MIVKESIYEKKRVLNSEDITYIMREVYTFGVAQEDFHKELFYSIGLNARHTVLYIDLIGLGTVDHCNPPLREIFKTALDKNAVSIILVHNHPSGKCKPSAEDKVFTEGVKKVSKILQITLLDHIIFGSLDMKGNHLSMADEGLL